MFARLDAPPDIAAKNAKAVADVRQEIGARKVRVSERKRRKFERHIRTNIESWERNTSTLRQRLRRLNDFFKGKPEQVDYPFGGQDSSRIDLRYAIGQGRALESKMKASAFSDPSHPFVAELGPGAGMERVQVSQLEAAVNWAARYDCNLVETLKDTFIPAFRDGMALIFGEWERRVERGVDYKTYATVEEFQADYPDASTAGISRDRYQTLLDELGKYECALQVEFETEFVAKNAPEFTLFPLAKLIWAPLFVKQISECDIYGYLTRQKGSDFEAHSESGFYDKEAAEAVSHENGTGDLPDQWDKARDELDGLTGGENDSVSYNIAILIVRFDLDDRGSPSMFKVWWEKDKGRALRIEPYGVRRNLPCVIPFRLERCDGRFLPESLLADGEDLYRLLNAIHRHRSNVRRLTDSVTIVAPKAMQEDFDLGAESLFFRPGMTIWVDDKIKPDQYPHQLQIHNLSNSRDSTDEEGFAVRYLEFITGISEGQSGMETRSDPNAPGNKTAMLLAQADGRTNDHVEEWRRTVPDATDLMRAFYFQNGPAKMAYIEKEQGIDKEKSIPSVLLANIGVRLALKPTSPANSPESEMNKIAALTVYVLKNPVVVQMQPMVLVRLYNAFIAASRIEPADAYQIKMGDQGPETASGQPVGPEQILGMIQAHQAAQAGQQAQPAPAAPGA